MIVVTRHFGGGTGAQQNRQVGILTGGLGHGPGKPQAQDRLLGAGRRGHQATGNNG